MFNFFKFGKTNFIPSDINKGMMSSNFCTFKLGETLTLPENINCLICYKDKIYYSLESGSHKLSRESLLDLYEKQSKNNKKLKKLKIDFYFINKKTFSYNFSYIDKVPINDKLTKILFDVKIDLNVSDNKLFYKFVVFDWASADSYHTEELVLNYVELGIRNYFLKRKLSGSTISANQQTELEEKLTKHLNNVGLEFRNLELKLTPKTKIVVAPAPKGSFFDVEIPSFNNIENHINVKENLNEIEETKTNIVDQTTQIDYTNNETFTNESAQQNLCPICKCKLITGSPYCHRCGYKI